VKGVDETLRCKLTIAQLPNIERLNGSRVSADEHDTANRAFIRHYANAQSRPPRSVLFYLVFFNFRREWTLLFDA